MYLELDPDQSLVFPGTISASLINRPLSPFSDEVLAFPSVSTFYGHTSPSDNVELFKSCITTMSQTLEKKKAKGGTKGTIINTSGWVENEGFDVLTFCIDKLDVDAIIVIDHERLFNDLTKKYKDSKSKVFKIQKSGGVGKKKTKQFYFFCF